MNFVDAVSLAGTRRTADGYLVADAKAVRTGVQTYLGAEVGRPDLAIARVYRSEDEVRSADSLRSFSHAPVTLDHPSVPVTAANWKTLAVGEVSTAATWDGNRISLPLILKDADAIQQAEGGKRELSAGYTCDLDWTPGLTPDGLTFDAQQRNIRANHVAIVDRGRAGPECRIGDAGPHSWGPAPIRTPESIADRKAVRMKTHLIDGHAVEMSDAAIIAVSGLQKTLATTVADNLSLTAAVSAKDGEILKLQADHAVAVTAKDKEIADLKAQALTADKLDAAVAERSAVLDAARPVLGADFDPKGKTVGDIRRAAVAKRLGDKAVEGKADEHVAIAFDTLTATLGANDPLRQVISGGLKQNDSAVTVGDAYGAMCSNLTDAWKGPQNQKAA